MTALAGIFYSELTEQMADEPGNETAWQHWLRLDQEAREAGKLEHWYGEAVDRLLRQRGLHIDQPSRARLLEAISAAARRAGEHLKKNAAGDYSPDPAASRFPEWKPRAAPKDLQPTSGKTSLTGILADWWKEAQATGRKPSTHESYGNTVDGFVAFSSGTTMQHRSPPNTSSASRITGCPQSTREPRSPSPRRR